MPRLPDPLPSELGDVFTAAQAKRLGVSSRRLSLHGAERVSYGTYRRARADGTDETMRPAASRYQVWRDGQLACALAVRATLPSGHFFAEATAAMIWGLPTFGDLGSQLQVACFTPARPLRRPDIQSRRVQANLASVVWRLGVPVSTPASTWAMLAPKLSLRDAVALGDAVIRQHRIPGTTRRPRPPFATLEELERAAGAGRRVGVGQLRQTLPLLSTQSASVPESHLRLLLQGWDAPTPQLDFDVRNVAGRLLGCSEFAYPKYRLALEYEGEQHRVEGRQWNRDIEKYRHYAQSGWEVIRITATLLYRQPDELRQQVFEALARRGWRHDA